MTINSQIVAKQKPTGHYAQPAFTNTLKHGFKYIRISDIFA